MRSALTKISTIFVASAAALVATVFLMPELLPGFLDKYAGAVGETGEVRTSQVFWVLERTFGCLSCVTPSYNCAEVLRIVTELSPVAPQSLYV
jgi:hypothetical protein